MSYNRKIWLPAQGLHMNKQQIGAGRRKRKDSSSKACPVHHGQPYWRTAKLIIQMLCTRGFLTFYKTYQRTLLCMCPSLCLVALWQQTLIGLDKILELTDMKLYWVSTTELSPKQWTMSRTELLNLQMLSFYEEPLKIYIQHKNGQAVLRLKKPDKVEPTLIVFQIYQPISHTNLDMWFSRGTRKYIPNCQWCHWEGFAYSKAPVKSKITWLKALCIGLSSDGSYESVNMLLCK